MNNSRNEDAYVKGSTLENNKKLPSDEPHPETGPYGENHGENSRNDAKKQKKSVLKPIIINILSCLTSLDSSNIIQTRISVNYESLSTPITTLS